MLEIPTTFHMTDALHLMNEEFSSSPSILKEIFFAFRISKEPFVVLPEIE